MTILTGTNLSQSHGFTDVFTGISVSIAHDAKIGLIGPNGVGKTTLLRVLAGIDQPVAGSVHVARDKRVGYLPQEAMDAFAGRGNTVYAEMLGAFDHLHAIEARMRELERAMANGDADAMREYGDLQERFAHGGGYEIEARIKHTLDGLGFDRSQWDMPVAHLSGGQKTRALLARLLFEQPDLLVLDEPTNHLDVDALEWLEKTLIAWPGALLISSHDRYFLDRVVNHIWEMSRSKIEIYRGRYTAYTQQREARFQRSLFVFNQVKADFENELRIIKRDLDNLKGGNGDKVVTWVKGKLRRMTREIVAVETLGAEALMNDRWSDIAERVYVPFPFTYEEAERRVRALRPPSRPPRLRLSLGSHKRGSEVVLRTTKLVVGYPGNVLCDFGDVEIRWRDRVALIGPNGAGKTTFVRTALGAVAPVQGEVALGPSVIVGYFAQAHDELDEQARVIEEVQRHRRMSDGEVRHYLAQFLFTDDDAFKPVGGLSGGERARLALAILQLKGANFLVLDEPTNHLDITAQETLQEALEQYDGTILLVSHDRYLINRLATQIWHIEGGRLHVYRGTFAEWMKWRAIAPSSPRGKERGEEVGAPNHAAEVAVPRSARNDKRSKNAERKRQQQIAEAEARVAALEARLRELGEALQSVKGSDEARGLGIEYALVQRELDEAMKQWEQVAA